MKTLLLALLALSALPAHAQEWSIGAATGPFVFGDFVERTLRITTEDGSAEQTIRLSAGTRAGLGVDIERRLSDRFAIRLDAAFTRAPLSVKGDEDDGVELDAGDVDVTTLMLPVVFRINRAGAFRFQIHAGPAWAAYRISARSNAEGVVPIFTGTRTQFGWATGGGVGWQMSGRAALEGQITDIITTSPFEDQPVTGLGRVKFPRPHNVHTTIGVRYRF